MLESIDGKGCESRRQLDVRWIVDNGGRTSRRPARCRVPRRARGPWRATSPILGGRTERRHHLCHVLDTMEVGCRVDNASRISRRLRGVECLDLRVGCPHVDIPVLRGYSRRKLQVCSILKEKHSGLTRRRPVRIILITSFLLLMNGSLVRQYRTATGLSRSSDPLLPASLTPTIAQPHAGLPGTSRMVSRTTPAFERL